MLIDWFTVAAQALNFIVLMILLKVFLYDRIVKAMDQREQNIQERLESAREEREMAEAQKRKFETEQRELAQQREEIVRQARKEAASTREELLDKARKEADDLRQGLNAAVRQETDSFVHTFREQAAALCIELTRRSLAAMGDVSAEEQAATAFRKVLENADPETAARLQEAAEEDGSSATVVSATALPGSAKSAVTRAVHELIGKDVAVDYAVDEELVLGMELRCGGRSLGWTVRDYLDAVSREVRELLTEEQPTSASGASSSGASSSGQEEAGTVKHVQEEASNATEAGQGGAPSPDTVEKDDADDA
ncbi:F0F1 ATP synthase subunit delta [Oceanidesulfovibrio marinus]|uniref:ATP synthase subunit b n=1 Tax=Oceanidesulfovibrio marinus TaxID=370038 RepID=A0ABX6NM59_9BACT|nr:F0F1 ATP synthase subunit delta [Oceanidesulfovibrio marinus]QJT10780.1 hypothetical protein E8L03_18475 [Oceanidesulfovibrio marinus]